MTMDKQKRKEMAKAYVQTHRPMGVYQLLNKTNGKRLIGSSMNLDGAYNGLRFQLNMGSYYINKELQDDWKKYGEENFSFEVLQTLKPQEEFLQSDEELVKYKKELEELEQLMLEELQPYGERGYNKPDKNG
ncbi:hypothetical protein XYCOK13_41630 [Xylanibacillus composti]|uniref:GIY-YIG nuclease family protein n=1 Tax=Xylanibacillus composti TaxID=1572762 RepID=A0A8J4H5R1_9BACL|nr:GIY-YIG nuclease family protein [Xylanibacillus composti]GIQ71339.1 hypothetical protein XYCOK13_41630 [Xylanibacillus composti]